MTDQPAIDCWCGHPHAVHGTSGCHGCQQAGLRGVGAHDYRDTAPAGCVDQRPVPAADRRERYAALFRSPPGEGRLGDEPPGVIADAVIAIADRELEELRAEVERLMALHEAHLRVEQRLAREALPPGPAQRRTRKVPADPHEPTACPPGVHSLFDPCPGDCGKPLNPQEYSSAPAAHIGNDVNAEDCPGCKGTNPPYPFICPGPQEQP